jgi:uncharacterized protein (DUF1330 family)
MTVTAVRLCCHDAAAGIRCAHLALLLLLAACGASASGAVAAAGSPSFLILQWEETGESIELDTQRLSRVIRDTGGEVVAAAAAGAVQVLERESSPMATLILRWQDRAALSASWAELSAVLPGRERLRVVAVDGLPAGGLPPDATLPNVANVPRIETDGRQALMLVQGTVSDPGAMPAYRALIQPMLVERGAYYIVYASADDVEVLGGDWQEHALIISRWPDRALANDFWFSETYQNEAIPARISASRFSVLLLEEGCSADEWVHLCEP